MAKSSTFLPTLPLVEVFMLPLLFQVDSVRLWAVRMEILLLCKCCNFPVSFRCLSRHFWSDLSVQQTFLTDFQWTNSKSASSLLEMTIKHQWNSRRLVFAGPVDWTENFTETELDTTAKDRTTGCGCPDSESFQLPVLRFDEN